MGRREQVEELAALFINGAAPTIQDLKILAKVAPSVKELLDLGVQRQQVEQYLQRIEMYVGADGTLAAIRQLQGLCGQYQSTIGLSPLRLGVYLGLDEGDQEPQYYQVLGLIKPIDGQGYDCVAYFPLHNSGLGSGLRSRAYGGFFGSQDNGEPRFTYVGQKIPVPEPAKAASA